MNKVSKLSTTAERDTLAQRIRDSAKTLRDNGHAVAERMKASGAAFNARGKR